MGPIQGLRQSRKAVVGLVVGLIDLLTPLVLFFVGKYAPFYLEDAKIVMVFVAGAVTLVGGVLIGAIAYEDGQAKRVGAHFTQTFTKPHIEPESEEMA